MEDIIAPVRNFTFDFEHFLEKELDLYLNERKSKRVYFSHDGNHRLIRSDLIRARGRSVQALSARPVPIGRTMSIQTQSGARWASAVERHVQALAARAVQEGRQLRVPARVQHEEDAGVLVLFELRRVQQRRVHVLAHWYTCKFCDGISLIAAADVLMDRPGEQDQGVRLVRVIILYYARFDGNFIEN